MELRSAVLVIADISGYTRFVMMHTTSLLHAESIITELLEAVISRAEHPLTIAKLEGDAVFLYSLVDGDERAAAQDALGQVNGFFEAFRAKERELIACNTCGCPACRSMDKLHLKVVLHHGEVVIKKVGQFVELAGQSVILVHRLLKNSVTAKDYVLMTESFQQLSGGLDRAGAEARTEHAEGMGEVRVVVYPLEADRGSLARAPAGTSAPGSEGALLYERMNAYAYRRLNGLESRRVFSSLPDEKLNWLHRADYAFGRLMPKIMGTLQGVFGKRG